VLHEPARVLGVSFESDDLVGYWSVAETNRRAAAACRSVHDLWERMRERAMGCCACQTAARSSKSALLCLAARISSCQSPDKVDAVSACSHCGSPTCHGRRAVRARWEQDATNPATAPLTRMALAEQLAGPTGAGRYREKDGKPRLKSPRSAAQDLATLMRWLEASAISRLRGGWTLGGRITKGRRLGAHTAAGAADGLAARYS